jgi:hypothetical protein
MRSAPTPSDHDGRTRRDRGCYWRGEEHRHAGRDRRDERREPQEPGPRRDAPVPGGRGAVRGGAARARRRRGAGGRPRHRRRVAAVAGHAGGRSAVPVVLSGRRCRRRRAGGRAVGRRPSFRLAANGVPRRKDLRQQVRSRPRIATSRPEVAVVKIQGAEASAAAQIAGAEHRRARRGWGDRSGAGSAAGRAAPRSRSAPAPPPGWPSAGAHDRQAEERDHRRGGAPDDRRRRKPLVGGQLREDADGRRAAGRVPPEGAEQRPPEREAAAPRGPRPG